MNTCGNCKHWHGCDNVEENHAHYCYEEYNDEQDARTTADASCPRFTAKEPEIPAVLKERVPVWHPESEKPEVFARVLVADDQKVKDYKEMVKEAAAELAELKEELETRTTQFQEALSESVKDKQTIARLRADLDEARKVIEKVATYWNNENARDYAVAWLKAHTEVEG